MMRLREESKKPHQSIKRYPTMTRLLQLVFLLLLVTLPGGVMALMTRSKALKELGLSGSNSKTYSDKDLKSAYRKRSLETHPDKGGTKDDFIRVAQAYEFLTEDKGGSSSTAGGGPSSNQNSSMSPEEQMKWAEEMFDHFADLMGDTDATADAMVDWLFDTHRKDDGKSSQKQELSLGASTAKGVVRFIARRVAKAVMSMLEGDNVKIDLMGQEMSGKEFQQWRKNRAARNTKKARPRRKVESDL